MLSSRWFIRAVLLAVVLAVLGLCLSRVRYNVGGDSSGYLRSFALLKSGAYFEHNLAAWQQGEGAVHVSHEVLKTEGGFPFLLYLGSMQLLLGSRGCWME